MYHCCLQYLQGRALPPLPSSPALSAGRLQAADTESLQSLGAAPGCRLFEGKGLEKKRRQKGRQEPLAGVGGNGHHYWLLGGGQWRNAVLWLRFLSLAALLSSHPPGVQSGPSGTSSPQNGLEGKTQVGLQATGSWAGGGMGQKVWEEWVVE